MHEGIDIVRKKFAIIMVIICFSVLTSCNKEDSIQTDKKNDEAEVLVNMMVLEEEESIDEIDLQTVRPNEMGEVMVLMYHHIDEPEAEWTRTPENFRKDLLELYDRGYRPISLEDYVRGNIGIPAGYKPIVLTFDDGNQNNFNMIEDQAGEWIIDPNCAVGILVDFHENHPDFPLKASFFINGGTPFGQADWLEYKLNYLVEMGMDIGNHTNTHINFTNASAEKIQEEIGRVNNFVKQYLPEYEINTLALPFGSKPKDDSLLPYLLKGQHDGIKYENIGILEVGWDPYKSPHDEEFDFTKIRRVRASETKVDGVGIYNWLETLEKGTRLPYISDGQADIITVPEQYRGKLSKNIKDENIRYYDLKDED